MKFSSLSSPLQVGPYRLNHRAVMAPLTRMRAEKPSLAPRPLNAEYYDGELEKASTSVAFRGDAQHRTRNVEIPGSRLRRAPE